jgi:hypothetical protein
MTSTVQLSYPMHRSVLLIEDIGMTAVKDAFLDLIAKFLIVIPDSKRGKIAFMVHSHRYYPIVIIEDGR